MKEAVEFPTASLIIFELFFSGFSAEHCFSGHAKLHIIDTTTTIT